MPPVYDLTGQTFGCLTVLSHNQTATTAESSWWCHCRCGKIVSVRSYQLRTHRTRSCGCLRQQAPANRLDLTGQVFTRLTVETRDTTQGHPKHSTWWICSCSCGNSFIASTRDLRQGSVQSCGCLRAERLAQGHLVHGNARKTGPTPEYKAWQKIKERCLVLTSKDYPRYGGRGIQVCPQWVESFSTFLADMGPRSNPLHSIERRDNDGPYAPDNCYWATRKEQARNTRNNVLLTWNGETHCLSVWSELVHIRPSILADRYRAGWSIERLLMTPPRRWPSQVE